MRNEGPALTALVGTNSATVGDWPVSVGCGTIVTFQVTNNGPGALTSFDLQVQCHSAGTPVSVISGTGFAAVATGTNSGSTPLLGSSAAINTLASGGTAIVSVAVYSAHTLRFKATSAAAGSNGSTVTILPSITNA